MSFTPTITGRCDCCFAPGGEMKPLMVSSYDAGGGDIREQQICEVCSQVPHRFCSQCGIEGLITTYVEGESSFELCARCISSRMQRSAQISSLSVIAEMHTVGNTSLPISFFAGDGTLRPPPWEYMGTTIDILKKPEAKTLTIVIPVLDMLKLSPEQARELTVLAAALRETFSQIVPETWRVLA